MSKVLSLPRRRREMDKKWKMCSPFVTSCWRHFRLCSIKRTENGGKPDRLLHLMNGEKL